MRITKKYLKTLSYRELNDILYKKLDRLEALREKLGKPIGWNQLTIDISLIMDTINYYEPKAE